MTSFVRATAENGVGHLVLDRPEALNAMDLGMIRDLHRTLTAWAEDPRIRRAVVTSSSPKAFCAGGDIRQIREHAVAGERDQIREYFAEEYQLDLLTATYPKEYVAVIDGYAFGGGLGISVHGAERVATERAVAAMPETVIGFFPDVGASHFLPRLRGELGAYLGLTGARLTGSDVVAAGVATRYIPHDRLADATAALLSGVDLDSVWGAYTEEVPALSLPLDRIDAAFAGNDVGEILARLEAETDEWATTTLDQLHAASPTSLVVALRLIRAGSETSLAECFARELELDTTITATHDFIEGVRAALVDKDRSPTWRPATVAEVSAAQVDALFAPSPA